jgi:leucine dehydrogenase
MGLFDVMAGSDHQQVLFTRDPQAGYRGIIAIHDTTLGPALGGTRLWAYGTEDDALRDVLRLAEGMTYKAALADVRLGGGKAVILEDDAFSCRESLFRAHGRAVDALGGRYITAEDVGTTVEDMAYVRKETEWVVGLEGGSGDPSPVTAYGVYQGMRACAMQRYGHVSLSGRHVTVQGLGNVGYHLCGLLAEEGARLSVTDLDPTRIERVRREFGAGAVPPDRIHALKADIFAPCALGGSINDETLPELDVDIVAGAANNQLEEPRHGRGLAARGILYAPDYVINAGGLINVYGELRGWTADRSRRKAASIYWTLLGIFGRAEKEAISPAEAADRIARQRIQEKRGQMQWWKREPAGNGQEASAGWRELPGSKPAAAATM